MRIKLKIVNDFFQRAAYDNELEESYIALDTACDIVENVISASPSAKQDAIFKLVNNLSQAATYDYETKMWSVALGTACEIVLASQIF